MITKHNLKDLLKSLEFKENKQTEKQNKKIKGGDRQHSREKTESTKKVFIKMLNGSSGDSELIYEF